MAIFNGTSNDDIFTGGADADIAYGNAGNDTLSGAANSDRLAGGAGADVVDGGDGDDRLYSGDESPAFNLPYYSNTWTAPQLDTGAEVDTLSGGAGDDRLFAGYGDNVDGGANGSMGDYLYISFMGATAGIAADFRNQIQVIGGGTIQNVENISWVQGSNFDDVINVASYASNGYSDFTAVFGMGGNDSLTAGYYTGTMFGGDGDDVIDGRSSGYMQLVDGGAGDDFLYTPTNSFASASGGDGNDTIYSHGQTWGGAGDDLIVLQYSYYTGLVSGGTGNDEIRASAAGHTIAGGDGADILKGSTGADKLYSGNFVGETSETLPGVGRTANAADDMGLEHDVLTGDGGNDVLHIGYGDDADGGDGSDSLQLSLGGLAAGITFSTAGIVSGQPFTLGGGVIRNIETLTYLRGTEFADVLTLATQSSLLTVDAGGGNDVVYSSNSSVSLFGGAGDDRLVSGAAGDIFDGGAGSDTIDYSVSTIGVSVDLAAGTGGGGDTLTNVENVVGSTFNDTIRGSDVANILEGGAGDDILDGRGGSDTASYANATGGVSVSLRVAGPQATGGAGIDTLISIENLIGSASSDVLVAATTGSTLQGLAGGDTLVGGAGNDILDGGAGVDTANYINATGGVTVNLSLATAQTVGGGQGSDTLSGIENLIGSVFNDTLTGDGADNVLSGSFGDDTLNGGAGDDILEGGAGDDTLVGGGSNTRDTVSYASATAGVTVNLNAGTATGGAGNDTISGIRGIIGSSFGDTLTSTGNGGLLQGMGGDDVFHFGGTATDAEPQTTFDGGDGMDLFSFAEAFGPATATLLAGSSSFSMRTQSGAYHEGVLVNIEGFIGSGYGDTLTGDAGANTLRGEDGNDKLYGLDGDDILEGGDVDDILDGGTGNDFLSGGAGTDTLYGLDGNDILVGGGGTAGAPDYFYGGAGNDTYYVASTLNSPLDLVFEGTLFAGSEAGANDIDSIHSTGQYFWDYYSVGEILHIDNAIDGGAYLVGGKDVASKTIYGSSGTDYISTYGGDARVDAGAGSDAISFELYGLDESYRGSNTVVMKAGSGADYVHAFRSGVDHIDLTAFNFGITGQQVLDQAVNVDNPGTADDYCYFYLTSAGGVDNYIVFMGLLSSQLQASDFVT